MKLIFFLLLMTICTCLKAQDFSSLTLAELDSLMIVYYEMGDFDLTVQVTEAGREKAKKAYGTLDTSYAKFTCNLGLFYKEVGEYEQAEVLLLEGIKIVKKIRGEEHSEYATAIHNLGLVYRNLGDNEKALKLFNQSLAIVEKTLGKEHADYADCLESVAFTYGIIGDYALAEKLYLQALKIEKRVFGENSFDYAMSTLNLGALYHNMENLEAAEALYLRCMEIWKATDNESHPQFATTLNNLAELYKEMGKYVEAEPLFLQVVELDKKNLGEEHPYYATSLGNLASLYHDLGKLEEAKKLYLEELRITEKAFGKMHSKYATALNNISDLYSDMGDIAKSLECNLETVNIFKKTLGEQHHNYATALGNLAVTYDDLGQHEKAEPLFKKAAAIQLKAWGKHHPDYINALIGLGDYYKGIEQPELALSYYHQAILTNCKDANLDSLTLSKSLAHLGTKEFYSQRQVLSTLKVIYYISRDAYKKDKEHNLDKLAYGYTALQAALQISETIRNSVSSEEDKLRLLKEISDLARYAINTGERLISATDKSFLYNSFQYAEQNKSMLLADAIKGNQARTFGALPDSLSAYELDLQEQRKELAKEIIKAKNDTIRATIQKKQNSLNIEINAFLKKIKDEFPQYHQLKYKDITATIQDVQKLLDKETMLLEYFVSEARTYLFAITQDSVWLFPLETTYKEMSNKIHLMRLCLSNYTFISKNENKAFEKYAQTAFWCYNILLKPALEKQKVKNLVIIADEELGHLPFEAFLTKSVGQKKSSYNKLPYLINNYTISYNYSATLWKENLNNTNSGQKKRSNKGILACAASYDKIDNNLAEQRDPAVFMSRKSLKPLPAALKEIDVISNIFKGDYLKGMDANEAFFKQHAADYNIIHLAMHGILHPRTPMLSSLAFTENRDSLEDNFLQAYEISKLNLNADLVVLSACETGYGKFKQGEGVISLARSFMYAGVPSLVVSLWQVNDGSTAILMKEFYTNLAKGMTKDAALREAKLYYIKNAQGILAHPAFWSPFIQLGDNRAIVLQTKGGYLIWGIGGALFVLGIGGFLAFRKK